MFSGRNHMFSLTDRWASHSNRKRHLSWHRLQSPLHSLVGRLLRTKAKMQGVTKGRSNWRRRWQGGTGGKKRKLLRKLLWRRSLLKSYCLCFPWKHQQLVFCYWLFWRASMWWVWWENCAHWLEYSSFESLPILWHTRWTSEFRSTIIICFCRTKCLSFRISRVGTNLGNWNCRSTVSGQQLRHTQLHPSFSHPILQMGFMFLMTFERLMPGLAITLMRMIRSVNAQLLHLTLKSIVFAYQQASRWEHAFENGTVIFCTIWLCR